MKLKEIAHYAYFSMLSSEEEKDVEDIVARDLADIENKINEYTNSKLNKIIEEIEKKGKNIAHDNWEIGFYTGLCDAITIIKREITKKD